MPFIRIKWIPSGKGRRPYRYLVKNYRENGKVKQKIVKYLGPANLDDLEEELGKKYPHTELTKNHFE